MNKVILGLILAVCVLGMALVMLNERLGRKTETAANQTQTEKAESMPPAQTESWQEKRETPPPASAPEAERAESIEIAEAKQALAPPMEENVSIKPPAQTLPEPEERRETGKQAPPAPVIANDAHKQAPPAPVAEKPKAEPKPAVVQPEARQEPKTEKAPAKSPAQPTGRVINRFVVFAREGGATIRVGSPAKLNFTSMTLENPDRVVVDMAGNWQFPANPGIPKNEIVSNIRTGKLGDKTRVVIDLKSKPKSVRVIPAMGGDGFDVRVDR